MRETWRARAAPIIARVLKETAGLPEGQVRRALAAAYPWQRSGWAYKAWLAEVRAQAGPARPPTPGPLGGLFAGENDHAP